MLKIIYHNAEIPSYPENYTAGTVLARVVDGLGFRYYWATEGLRDQDLRYKPSEQARTTLETLNHIFSLTRTIRNSLEMKPTRINSSFPEMNFEELRTNTLKNIKFISESLKSSKQEDFNSYQAVFENADQRYEYPFWNQINGPIADALWHVGQVVSFRRSSGNPLSPNVNVFEGRAF